MIDKGYERLQINAEFKNLIRPLSREEYAQLEANLVADGCRDPIIAWNGTIVDGHNRYEICNRLDIPYAIQEVSFDQREAAIIWICGNQLGRRNITEETRKYLIGRQYEAEKIIGFHRNARGRNQYTRSRDSGVSNSPAEMTGKERRESAHRTATRLGDQYHLSSGAVQKYAKYSQALDALGKKIPDMVPKILSGNYKISHENIVALSEMDTEEMKDLSSKMGVGSTSYIRYSESRRDLSSEREKKSEAKSNNIPAIKTMPAYDPDSLANGLAFTIPSWAGSVERARTKGDLNRVSPEAKTRLKEALELLRSEIQALLAAMKGEF
ncbi:MAG: hypothetical protein VB099_11100 [Candidatus Limiplasma sp.]|nr:hypothetical protein [Candidatus Limiplasma sp.]